MLPAHQTDIWKPATDAEKIQSLVTLAALPSRETSAGEIDRASYFVALDGVTRHGLSEAVKFILRGALKHTFFPSPVELRQQCDRAMEWHVQEAERIRRREQIERERIPPRQEPTPESKARVAALMAKFNANHESSKQADIEAERAEIRARYGMTPEALAGIKDQPVPANFDQVGQAARKSA